MMMNSTTCSTDELIKLPIWLQKIAFYSRNVFHWKHSPTSDFKLHFTTLYRTFIAIFKKGAWKIIYVSKNILSLF